MEICTPTKIIKIIKIGWRWNDLEEKITGKEQKINLVENIAEIELCEKFKIKMQDNYRLRETKIISSKNTKTPYWKKITDIKTFITRQIIPCWS